MTKQPTAPLDLCFLMFCLLETAQALKEYTLRSLTGEPPQRLKYMEFCRCYSLVVYLHGLGRRGGLFSRNVRCVYNSRAPITITCLVVGVMRGVYLVELSFPTGGTRVPFHLAGDVDAY